MEERPDPDAVLRRVQQDEARRRRGRLKIYFGFAPGVGKTFRMLRAAHEARAQGIDVVVGIVETHARADTVAQLAGLEVLPRRRFDYRGRRLEELDVDAALARRPQLLLVDELAHSNAPGSRHTKRWQDVNELLDAGIDVSSTVNVQHLESLNDVVAQITHVRVRETIPDAVLDAADAVELVDLSADELLARLREGKVYLAAQAARAADHFFKRGNLLALRELALRRTAQHVDDDVLAYREANGVRATWPAGERLLVCVGPAPSSARLIRAAARMAAGLRSGWVAAYVEAATPLPHAGSARLDEHLRLASSLGAKVVRLTGARVSQAVLDYARKHNVNRVSVGKPTHSRWRDRLRGSLLDELVRGSGDIDVHVIRGDDVAEPPPPLERLPSARPSLARYVAAALIVLVTLLCAVILQRSVQLPDLEMLFLLAVMIAAVWLGRGPALLAASLGVASYDFFFAPPVHTFSVADRKYILTFAMMFGIGLVISELAARLRRQERAAVHREERTSVLYALTRSLAASDRSEHIATVAAEQAHEVFGSTAEVLVARADALDRSSVDGSVLDDKDFAVAKWAYEHGQLAGMGTDTLPGAAVSCAPLQIGRSRLGVLVLRPAPSFRLGVEQREFVEVFARQVANALERVRLTEQAQLASVRAKTEEMRSSLLSAVSHDLRTPLATIAGAATVLRDEARLDGATKLDLADAIVSESARLERLVANLLDMTRLDSGALVLRKDWVPAEEIIGSALTRLDSALGSRSVEVEVAADVPLLHVDPVLFEQLLVNLLENSIKHAHADSPIVIRVRLREQQIELGVRDRGPGVPPGGETRIFEKFFRGDGVVAPGAGLGLAICKGIAEAHGGHIRAENHGAGADFFVTVPGESPPPLQSGENDA